MKNCVNCENSLPSNAKFCPECGSKQPEESQVYKNPDYSASIGDKNVISGNIIGKSEEYKISGSATINKIEDDTKKFIICAVSGKHLLRGRDIVMNCSICKSDVAQDCINQSAGRCHNCDREAYAQYSDTLDTILADGIIDVRERMQLDVLSMNLMIDSSAKQRLEIEARVRKSHANLNTIGGNNTELAGFYKIMFKKAIALLFENNDVMGAVSMLASIHRENVFHDEAACLYFLTKTINNAQDYIEGYEKKDQLSIDVYWEDFWAFIPYLKTGSSENGFKIIELNKARFSDNKNDILLSEVLAYLLLYSHSKDADYIVEAKSIYSVFGRNIKQPLRPLHDFIMKLLNSHEKEWEPMSRDFRTYDRFYYQLIFDGKTSPMTSNKSNGIKIKKHDFVIADESFISENRGRSKSVAKDSLYSVTSINEDEGTICIKAFPSNGDAAEEILINWDDLLKLAVLPNLSFENISTDDDVICVALTSEDYGFNSLIELGKIYSISGMNVRKNVVSLQEYPQLNKAEKVKWFHLENFRLYNNHEKLKIVSDNINVIPPVVEIIGNLVTKTFYSTTKFRSGKDIPIATSSVKWLEQCRKRRPAMCFYQKDTTKHALYNYYALLSKEGLSPEGYHIPFDYFFANEEVMKGIVALNLPYGIRKIGPDSNSGKNFDEFSKELWILTTISEDVSPIADDEYEDHVICHTNQPPDISTHFNNGFWGYPILLVKGEPVYSLPNDDITLDYSENTLKKPINSDTSQADKEYREKVIESKERPRLEKNELDREWDELEKRRKEKIKQQENVESEKKKRENDAINEFILQHAADKEREKEAAKNSKSKFKSRLKLPREWDSENLNTDVYRNGQGIIKANSKEDCIKYTEQKVGCYCYYNYLDSNAHFGKLYNWYAINSENGLAPDGYRIPSMKDWLELAWYLGAEKKDYGELFSGATGRAAESLKSEEDWIVYYDKGGNGNNESGLNIKPTPLMGLPESSWVGTRAMFWTTTTCFSRYEKVKHLGFFSKEISIPQIYVIDIHSDHIITQEKVDRDYTMFSVRCVKEIENLGWDA